MVRRNAKRVLIIKIMDAYKQIFNQKHQGRYEKSVEKLKKAFLRKVRRPPSHSEAFNIKKRFVDGIDRRITRGTRSWPGMTFPCKSVSSMVLCSWLFVVPIPALALRATAPMSCLLISSMGGRICLGLP